MFGKPDQKQDPPAPRAASDVALIQGGGLVHLIVTRADPLAFSLFLNDQPVPQSEIESLSVSIEAPGEGQTAPPTVSAVLSRYQRAVTGERSLTTIPLFPCTLEIVALGRRLLVVCQNADSLDGLWIDLGLKPDGTGNEVGGAQALRVV